MSTADTPRQRASLKAFKQSRHMLVQLSLALLLQADPSFQPRLAGVVSTSNAYTDAAGFAVLRFLSTWRTAWLQSVEYQGYGHNEIRSVSYTHLTLPTSD